MSVFSPLALTQALPFLPLAQGDIDYEVSRRGEPDLFANVLPEPATKVILVKDGKVAVPHGQGAIADYANVNMRLAQLPGGYVAAELRSHPTALAIFLGSYGGCRDEHVVAVDVTRVHAIETPVADSAYEGADDAFDEGNAAEAVSGKPSLLESAAERFDWVDLRAFAPHANAREAGQATTAISLGMWHTRQRHCPTCGALTEPALGGWAQRCTNEADGRRLLFPRVEPAVITAVCCCSTTAHGAMPGCIPFPRDSWRPARIWSTPAVARPGRRSASKWGSCDTSAPNRGRSLRR